MVTFKAIKCICKNFKLICSTQSYCSNCGTNFSGTCKNWLPWRILTYSEDAEAAADAAEAAAAAAEAVAATEAAACGIPFAGSSPNSG